MTLEQFKKELTLEQLESYTEDEIIRIKKDMEKFAQIVFDMWLEDMNNGEDMWYN